MSIVTDPYGDNWVVNEDDNDTALDRIFDMIDNESRKVDIMLQSMNEIDVVGRVMPETYSAMERYTPEILEDIIPGNEFFKRLAGKTKSIITKILKAFFHFLVMVVSVYVGTIYHILKIIVRLASKEYRERTTARNWLGDILEYRRILLGKSMFTDDDRYETIKEYSLKHNKSRNTVNRYQRMFDFLDGDECRKMYPKHHKLQIMKVWETATIYGLKTPNLVTYDDQMIDTLVSVLDNFLSGTKRWAAPKLYWYITVGPNAEKLTKNLKKVGFLRATDITNVTESFRQGVKVFSSDEFSLVYSNFITVTEVQGELIEKFQELKPGINELSVKGLRVNIQNFPVHLVPQIPVIDLAMEAAAIKMEEEPTVDQTTYLPNDQRMVEIINGWYQKAPALKSCFFKLIPPAEPIKPVNKVEDMSDEEYRESIKESGMGYDNFELFMRMVTAKNTQAKLKKTQNSLDNLSRLIKHHKKRVDKTSDSFDMSHLDETQLLYQRTHTDLMNENIKTSIYNIKLISKDLVDFMKTVNVVTDLLVDMKKMQDMYING